MKRRRFSSTSFTSGTRGKALIAGIAIALISPAAMACTNQLVHVYFDGCQPSASSIGATISPADGSKPIRITISKSSAQPYWRGTYGTSLDPVKSGERARLDFSGLDIRRECNVTADEEPDGNDCAVVYHVQCEPLWKLSVLSIEQTKVYDFSYKFEELAPQVALQDCGSASGNATTGMTVAAGEGQNIYIELEQLPFRIVRDVLLRKPKRSALISDFAIPIVKSPYTNSTTSLFDSTRAKENQPKVTVEALP